MTNDQRTADSHGWTAADMTELDSIPGGWTQEEIRIGERSWTLTRPAVPDAFLDDPAVLAAHAATDYMPYWPILWPGTSPMGQWLQHRSWPDGTTALELGCGLGLVGLIAAGRGLDVTYSDYDHVAVRTALWNARANGYPQATGIVLDWCSPPDQRYPIILGSEVIYDRDSHAPLLELTQRMLTPGGRAYFGDAGRTRADHFVAELERRQLRYRLFDERDQPLTALRYGQFQLFEVWTGEASAASE